MKGEWPELPTHVRGAGGPIRIRQIKRVRGSEGEVCWGTWSDGTRTIRIEKGALPEHKWRVFFHEWTHAALDDAGVGNLFTESGVETLCDAVATARVQEMRGQLGIKDEAPKQ